MVVVNVDVNCVQIFPQGGANNKGFKLGYIDSGDKGKADDTWTVKNAVEVIMAWPTVDATGASEVYTISGNVITLASVATTACSALILYK